MQVDSYLLKRRLQKQKKGVNQSHFDMCLVDQFMVKFHQMYS